MKSIIPASFYGAAKIGVFNDSVFTKDSGLQVMLNSHAFQEFEKKHFPGVPPDDVAVARTAW